MRKSLSLLCLLVLLAVATPAEAQLRADIGALRAPARLFSQGGPSLLFNKIFSPEHFKMMHSYEFSTGSFGGNTSSMGMYTNSMMWQFNNKLAARVDLSFAHSPFGGNTFGGQDNGLGNGKVFLRNAEVAYRPSENVHLHLSVRQSPYGSYMSPYAFYNPFGPGYYGHEVDDPFYNDYRRR